MSVLLLFSQSFSVFAVSIYQWVDSEGVTHFSDETPVEGTMAERLSQYEIEENYPQGRDPEEDYFSIINQWKRTNDERGARDTLRLTKNRSGPINLPQPQASYTDRPAERYNTAYYPSPYSYNRGRRFNTNHFQNRPGTSNMQQSRAVPAFMGNVAGGMSGSN